MKIKQLKNTHRMKHVDDGITPVIAKVFITSDGNVSCDYRFQGMSYSWIPTIEQAIEAGIIELIENKELVKK